MRKGMIIMWKRTQQVIGECLYISTPENNKIYNIIIRRKGNDSI